MVPGNFNLKHGDEYPMTWQAGAFKGIRLWADTSLADPANGVASEAPQKLRVAVLDAKGNWLQTEHVIIGRAPSDQNVWPAKDIAFKNAATAACLNITREDAGTKTVAFCLY